MQEGLWYGLFQSSNLWMSSSVTEQCVILVKVQDCWFRAGNSPPLHQKLHFTLAWVTFHNICSYWPIDPDHTVESSWSRVDIECICILWHTCNGPSEPFICGNVLFFKCVLQNWLHLSFGLNVTCNNTQFVTVTRTGCGVIVSIYLWPLSCFWKNSKDQSIEALMKTRNQHLSASTFDRMPGVWWWNECPCAVTAFLLVFGSMWVLSFDTWCWGVVHKHNTSTCLLPSDIAVVEMTDAFRQPSLFYHLGVRESFSMANNIILYCDTNSDALQSLQVTWTWTRTIPP